MESGITECSQKRLTSIGFGVTVYYQWGPHTTSFWIARANYPGTEPMLVRHNWNRPPTHIVYHYYSILVLMLRNQNRGGQLTTREKRVYSYSCTHIHPRNREENISIWESYTPPMLVNRKPISYSLLFTRKFIIHSESLDGRSRLNSPSPLLMCSRNYPRIHPALNPLNRFTP